MSNALLPLRYPIKPETLILGGMLTNIWIWSGHTSPSIISTPFHWHNCRSISRISKRFSSKNTFLLYFGANTMWYLQFHFVCAKLLVSMRSFFIDKSSDCVWFDWQVVPILSQSEDFFIGKPLLNHATIAWFSLYKKVSNNRLFRLLLT